MTRRVSDKEFFHLIKPGFTLSLVFHSIKDLFASILHTANESILLMIMEFPAFHWRSCLNRFRCTIPT
ncbi:MAG: hypothetical protein WB679_02380 [Terracidiphilus sp.]